MDKINVAEWVSRKISLFGKMQRGRSPSFELFQLDMYEYNYQIIKNKLMTETPQHMSIEYFNLQHSG